MTRRVALLLATAAAALLLCAGCRVMASHSTDQPGTVQTGQVTATVPADPVNQNDEANQNNQNADQLGGQLDQIQSTLDSVQAQISADAQP